jgi:hypothetical protein
VSGFAEHERYDALGLVDRVRRKDVSPSDLRKAASKRVEARQRRRVTRRSSGWPGKLEQAAVVRSQAAGRS